MNLADSIPEPLLSDLDLVRESARRLSIPIWLVGGPVRDALLGRPVSDLDILVETGVSELAEFVAGELDGTVRAHPEFMTATVHHSGERSIDFTTSREEQYERPGALPTVRPASIEEDLKRRDFTINAIAWDLRDESIIDPHDGRDDLRAGLVRILHEASFVDDPTRIFRAIRFSVRLGFDIEDVTQRAMNDALHAGALDTISTDRILRELRLCIDEACAAPVLTTLVEHGVFQHWLRPDRIDPDLPRRLAALAGLMGDEANLDRELLVLSALLRGMHDPRVPDLGLSKQRSALLARLVDGTGSGAARWKSLGADEERARFCLESTEEELIAIAAELGDAIAHGVIDLCRSVRTTRLPFTGADLNVPPGPHIAAALRDARARASVRDLTPEQLLSFAREAALRYLNSQNEANA